MKIFRGKVISKKMDKTATVAVERIVVHPLYKKRFKRTKKFHVHDDKNVNVGDEVKFVASKPYSKLKKWKITEVLIGQKEKPEKKKNPPAGGKKGDITKTRKAHKDTKK